MKNQKITVVIPAFNEEKIIFQNVTAVFNYLKSHFSLFEIIVVNDGSTDNTKNELEKLEKSLKIRILNLPKNEGKGGAVKSGVLNADNDSEILMFLDADLAIPIEELEKFIKEIEKGFDIVVASRFVPGVKILKPVKWYRKILEWGFRILRLIILNDYKIKDTQCGFKVFKKEVAKKIFSISKIKRFAFETEIIFLAKKMGFKIKELPVTLQNPTTTHVNIFFDPLNMFFDLIKIKLNYFFKKYNLSLN